jgi:energy-coupling factor transporter ATP-binding protein EcfA2
MLTRLEIQNFKAFGEHVRFDLRPLTVLVGPNGSGKSSALEAIGLISQSTPGPEQAPQFRWRDRLVDLGTAGASAFHKPDHDLQLSLTVELEGGDHLRSWLHKHNYDPVIDARSLGYAVGHRRGTNEWKHQLFVNGEVAATNATMALGRGLVKRGQGAFLECASTRLPERVFEPAVSGNAVLSPKLFMGTKAIGGKEVDDATHHTFIAFGLFMSYIGAYLKQRVFMVGPSRVPAREAPLPDAGPLTVGRRGERTITVLSAIFAHPRHLAQARKIQHWAEIFGLGSLTSGWVREELLHAGYLDVDFEAPLGFESAGCGSQQILPVITQIFSAPANSVILIEEPEASLHPEAQIDLARMLADAVRHGHQLLLTTHSQALLMRWARLAGPSSLIAMTWRSTTYRNLPPEPSRRRCRLIAIGPPRALAGPSRQRTESYYQRTQ